MAYVPNSGSVVAFQQNPSSLLVGASIIGLTPVNVVSGPGSVIAFPVGNQSVSGTVTVASLLAMPGIVSTANSTTTPVTSTLAFTGTGEEWKDFGSIVINVFTDAASGTDGLSIQQSSDNSNWDIRDTYTIPSMAVGSGKTFQVQPAARFGRVVYTQGAVNSGAFRLQTIYHPQMVKPTSQRAQDAYTNETDLEQTQDFNMVWNGATWDRMPGTAASGVRVFGSVLAQQNGTHIASVISSTPSSMLTGASIFGQLPAGTATLGSVVAYQGVPSWNVGGSVLAQQMGTHIASVISSTPSSMLTGASIFGMLPSGTQVIGSVAVLQGTNPWIETFSNSSILAVPVGSVITVLQAPSIVGTYAEDAGHTTADKGLFTLAVRNDTVASTASADTDYAIHAVDSAGRTLIKPFVSEDGTIITYVGSVVSGSVTLIQASAIGKKSYITDIVAVNSGSVATVITFQGGDTSILGYAIAPSGGGSNIPGLAIPWKTNASQDLAFKAGTSVSILYLTVKGYQAP